MFICAGDQINMAQLTSHQREPQGRTWPTWYPISKQKISQKRERERRHDDILEPSVDLREYFNMFMSTAVVIYWCFAWKCLPFTWLILWLEHDRRERERWIDGHGGKAITSWPYKWRHKPLWYIRKKYDSSKVLAPRLPAIYIFPWEPIKISRKIRQSLPKSFVDDKSAPTTLDGLGDEQI